jgi:hypothetical protein
MEKVGKEVSYSYLLLLEMSCFTEEIECDDAAPSPVYIWTYG